VIEEAFTNSFHESVFLLDEPTVVKRKAHADTAAANKGGFGFLTMPTFDPDFGWITSQMALIDSWVSARSVAPTNVITAKQSSAYNHSVYIN
jgi:hypothetical protein